MVSAEYKVTISDEDGELGWVTFRGDDVPAILERAAVWLREDAATHGSHIRAVSVTDTTVEQRGDGVWQMAVSLQRMREFS